MLDMLYGSPLQVRFLSRGISASTDIQVGELNIVSCLINEKWVL